MGTASDPSSARIGELERENELLRKRIDSLERRAKTGRATGKKVVFGGFRLLIPLIDRQKVARSFGELVETLGGLAQLEPADRPGRDEIVDKARVFLESVARFLIRRRLIVVFFSLIALAIPTLQLWLVFQQNQLFENQNSLVELEVYQLAATTLSSQEQNERRVGGALLAGHPEILAPLVAESFDPDLATGSAETLDAVPLRLRDTAFRSALVRAVYRNVEQRLDQGERAEDVYSDLRASAQAIVADAASRVPYLLRAGRNDAALDGVPVELREAALAYFTNLRQLLITFARLARDGGEESGYHGMIQGFLQRCAGRREIGDGRFADGYRAMMRDFLADVGAQASVNDDEVQSTDEAVATGLERLERLYEASIGWDKLASQVVVGP